MAEKVFKRCAVFVDEMSRGADLVEVYDKWAPEYDGDWKSIKTYGKDEVFDEVSRYLAGRENALILDVGSGTGYAGIALRHRGFYNLEAVDPSQGMLAIAREQGIYKKTFCQFFGTTPLPVPDATYDCIITVKTIVPRHFHVSWLKEFSRLLKPGGYFMLQGNYTIWCKLPEFYQDLTAEFRRLTDEGIWKLIEWRVTDHYFNSDNSDTKGLLLIYEKL